MSFFRKLGRLLSGTSGSKPPPPKTHRKASSPRPDPPKATAKSGGELGYYKLTDWWESSFTKKEQRRIIKMYAPLSTGDVSLTKGNITHLSLSKADFLSSLASWFKSPEDYSIGLRIVDKSISVCDDPLEYHFAYQAKIEIAYRSRNDHEGALDIAIAACHGQIENAPLAAEAFRREYPNNPLPAHLGFKQLAVVREKQREFGEAIRLSSEAKAQGWNGDWDKRIVRCEGRLGRG